jgi:hypothetical protein
MLVLHLFATNILNLFSIPGTGTEILCFCPYLSLFDPILNIILFLGGVFHLHIFKGLLQIFIQSISPVFEASKIFIKIFGLIPSPTGY